MGFEQRAPTVTHCPTCGRQTVPTHCTECGRKLRSRDAPAKPGTAVHGGRGICQACKMALYRSRTESRPVKRRVVPTLTIAQRFAEYVELVGAQPTQTKVGWTAGTIRDASKRLGIQEKSLRRTLLRHSGKVNTP